MNVRQLIIATAILLLGALNTFAADRVTYEKKAFQTRLDSGKPILVHVTAPWCGECKKQMPIVAALAQEPKYADLTIVDVDFDTQKDALRALNVQKQSTLVVYKDKLEVARAVGITSRKKIEALFNKAL